MSLDQNTFAERNAVFQLLISHVSVACIETMLCVCFPKMCHKWSNQWFRFPIFTILSSSSNWAVKINGSLRIARLNLRFNKPKQIYNVPHPRPACLCCEEMASFNSFLLSIVCDFRWDHYIRNDNNDKNVCKDIYNSTTCSFRDSPWNYSSSFR